jgi:hypothetical protein
MILMQPLDLSALPLNWTLARERFERDVRDDFFPDPFRNRDLFVAAKARFDSVLSLDEYSPEAAESWDVPKANLTLRHCINVSAVDRLVYQALVDYLSAMCDPQFSARSYAFRLRGREAAEMYKSFVEQKAAFDGAVRSMLINDPNAVVVTVDVAQYFENISFELLKIKLIELTGARLGHPTRAVIDVLMQCLARWSPYEHCGVPQNMFPSSFLGNVFLHSLDTAIIGAGFEYFRYMDDIRVVTRDEAEARLVLKLSITHLRDLELSVNGKKTGLVRPGTADWNALAAPPDGELIAIEEIVKRANVAELPACVVRLNDIMKTVIDEGGTNRARLRFCLGRLTSIRRLRRLAVPEPEGYGRALLELLKWLPEETTYVCEYLHSGDCSMATIEMLASLLTTERVCIYSWQNYHFWLLAAEKATDLPQIADRARQVIAGSHEPPEMAGAALFLGAAGSSDDLNALLHILRERHLSVSVRRALCIAIQQVADVERAPTMSELAETSATLAVLVSYLSKLPAPRFVARSRRVSLGRLADELPDNFS